MKDRKKQKNSIETYIILIVDDEESIRVPVRGNAI